MDGTIHQAATDADMDQWLAVRNAVDPVPMTLAGLRAERTTTPTSLDLLATVDGRVVGAGGIAWGRMAEESHNTFIDVWVLPAHRRRGLGMGLYERLATFGREGGMEQARVVVLEGDPDSLRFAESRGLHVDGGGQLGRLDLTTPPSPAEIVEPIDGIAIATYADRRDLERQMYELDILVQPEIPFLADQPIPSFESWESITYGERGLVLDLSLVAIEDDRVVGLIQTYDGADQTLFIGMTTVHPDTRRRGIARLLKAEMARRARAGGWRRIETFNDGTNARIRGLNESLGYVYFPPYIILRGPM